MEGLTQREQPDRSKINVHNPIELKYWLRALDVTKEDLFAAVKKVGDSAAIVRNELERLAARREEKKKDHEYIGKAAECSREARHQAALLPDGPIKDALLDKARDYASTVPEDKSY